MIGEAIIYENNDLVQISQIWKKHLLLKIMERRFSFSRYFPLSGHDEATRKDEVGSSRQENSLNKNLKLIPLLDEEQLRKVPSNEDWWARRRSQLIRKEWP